MKGIIFGTILGMWATAATATQSFEVDGSLVNKRFQNVDYWVIEVAEPEQTLYLIKDSVTNLEAEACQDGTYEVVKASAIPTDNTYSLLEVIECRDVEKVESYWDL